MTETWENRACRAELFIERFCVIPKGEMKGRPYILPDWQRAIVREIFGQVDSSGRRIIRNYYLSVGRKNAKTTLAAAIVLYLLISDPADAEIYSAASSRKQAGYVFDACKRMITLGPRLQALVKDGKLKVYQHSIAFIDIDGVERTYTPIAADAGPVLGSNPSAVLMDELREWKGKRGQELYDALTSGMGARREPLNLMLTTAGPDKHSLCYDTYKLAKDIAEGKKTDPSFGSFIAEAPDDADWKDIDSYAAANPNLHVSVYESFLKAEIAAAENSPSEILKVRQYYLNQWLERGAETYIGLDAWDACGEDYTEASLSGRPCFGGLDLASTDDLASYALVFPPEEEKEGYRILIWYWLPGDNKRERVLRDNVPYDQWEQSGHITLTDGPVIDYDFIFSRIVASTQQFDVKQVCFDRHMAVGIVSQLLDEGVPMVQHGQGFLSMAAPTKELLAYVLSKRLRHNKQPVLRWNISHLTVKMDDAGNCKPSKSLSREKIDGAVCVVMALSGALGSQQDSYLDYRGEEFLVL